MLNCVEVLYRHSGVVVVRVLDDNMADARVTERHVLLRNDQATHTCHTTEREIELKWSKCRYKLYTGHGDEKDPL